MDAQQMLDDLFDAPKMNVELLASDDATVARFLLEVGEERQIVAVGSAKRHWKDDFDSLTGRMLACGRALEAMSEELLKVAQERVEMADRRKRIEKRSQELDRILGGSSLGGLTSGEALARIDESISETMKSHHPKMEFENFSQVGTAAGRAHSQLKSEKS